jgi:hypothetical protein
LVARELDQHAVVAREVPRPVVACRALAGEAGAAERLDVEGPVEARLRVGCVEVGLWCYLVKNCFVNAVMFTWDFPPRTRSSLDVQSFASQPLRECQQGCTILRQVVGLTSPRQIAQVRFSSP